ncbi:MAG: DUF2892 domain-containing protein [Bacteroidales bacterium]|nr:DUF2892 domain-containing protein [Bacteroidales bacterium]
MKRNVGKIDKIVRIIIAAILVTLFFTDVVTGTLGIVFLVVAGIALMTALISFCGLYTVFGFSSCPMKKAKSR